MPRTHLTVSGQVSTDGVYIKSIVITQAENSNNAVYLRNGDASGTILFGLGFAVAWSYEKAFETEYDLRFGGGLYVEINGWPAHVNIEYYKI